VNPTAVDTSVLVAGLLAWHESHRAALRSLRAAGRGLVVPIPALVEAYAVMTRLPSPHRVAPERVLELLSGSLEGRASVVGLTGAETWNLLRSLAAEGVAGGRDYDAGILACAVKAGARRLLTLDAGDFGRLDARGVEIVVP
jgi:predicted nucleic acid-binding protein